MRVRTPEVNVATKRMKPILAAASALALAATLAACGGDDGGGSGDSGGGGSAGGGEPWMLGTTETVTAMDPAGSYDFGSWNMQYNIFEQLVSIPAGADEPEGDAAESCAYDDPHHRDLHAAGGPEVLQRQRPDVVRRAVLVPAQHRDRRPQRVLGAARRDLQR